MYGYYTLFSSLGVNYVSRSFSSHIGLISCANNDLLELGQVMFGVYFLHSSAACPSVKYELHHLEQVMFRNNYLRGLVVG